MLHHVSPNFERRWDALVTFLQGQQGIDARRFDATLQGLGLAAKRLVVTCWERLGEAGFRGALRLIHALHRAGQRLDGFVLPLERPVLELELHDDRRRRRRVALPCRTLAACGNGLADLVVQLRRPRPMPCVA